MSDPVVDRGDNLTDSGVLEDQSAEDTAAQKEADVAAAEQLVDGAAAAAAAGAADTEKTEEVPRDEKGRFIPLDRHKAVLDRERESREATERKLAALEQQIQQNFKGEDVAKVETEIVALELAVEKARLDGDADKAAALSAQIRLKERSIQDHRSETMSSRARVQAAEEVRVEMAITSLESTYDVLNAEKEDVFDQTVVDMVLAVQKSLIDNERMTPSKALLEAAKRVMPKVMAASKQEPAPKAGLAAAAGVSDRKGVQVTKNLDTARKQPPSLKDSGIDSDKAGQTKDIDVTRLSYSEFEALPETTKARLRGDMLE